MNPKVSERLFRQMVLEIVYVLEGMSKEESENFVLNKVNKKTLDALTRLQTEINQWGFNGHH
jgi:hypothetical protein